MRKFKLLALAFAIGTSSLFAINFEKGDPIEEPHPHIKKIVVKSMVSLQKEISIRGTLTLMPNGEIMILSGESNHKIKNLEFKMNYEDFKNEAAKNYSYSLRSDIMVKE